MFALAEHIRSFFQLIFPNICVCCNEPLSKDENVVCLFCIEKLPLTRFWEYKGNPVEKQFWGKVVINQAFALYHFDKGGYVQSMLHALKYKGQKEVGNRLGALLFNAIDQSQFNLDEIDMIIPVPLNKVKQRKRGFNQCDYIAAGFSEASGITWSKKYLIRKINNQTQTGKNRIDRWENTLNIFQLKETLPNYVEHILLLDDVVTTGSTIEACIHAIRTRQEELTISIATIAYTI